LPAYEPLNEKSFERIENSLKLNRCRRGSSGLSSIFAHTLKETNDFFMSNPSFKIDCLDDLFDDELGQLNNTTTFNNPQQHGVSRQDSFEQVRQAFSLRTSERHDDRLPVPSVPSTLGGGRKTTSDEDRAAAPNTMSPAAKKQKTSHERSGDGGSTMMGGRRSKRLRSRRQSSTIRFNNVVQTLHQHNEQEWDKQNCHYCGRCRPLGERYTCKNQYCSLQGQRVKYMCKLCYSHQEKYFKDRGLDVKNILGDVESPEWYCPACIIWEDNYLPHPGICCCSFRRNRIVCPLHLDDCPQPNGKRKAKHNFHCKPYKQKLKGDYKNLNMKLSKIFVGSKPYVRCYGKKPPSMSATAALSSSSSSITSKAVAPPAPASLKRFSDGVFVKQEKRPHARYEDSAVAHVAHSHLWLGQVASNNQLGIFIRGCPSPQSPLGEQKEYDASGKKKEEKNNKDDKNKDDTSGSGMLDGIPTTEYYKKKKGPLKRHGTC